MGGKIKLIEGRLQQSAVYWGTPVPDGYGGWTFAAPVVINVRWVKKQEKFVDATGEEVLSDAVVGVDRDTDIGGYLSPGVTSAAVTDPFDSGVVAWPIRAKKENPDLKADQFLYKVWL